MYITLANVYTFIGVLLGLYLMFQSYWLAATALFPRHVEACQQRYKRPVIATLVGLLVGLPIIVVCIGISSKVPNQGAKIIAILPVAVPVILGLAGSAGLARRIGGGLQAPVDANQPWRQVMRGGTVLWLTFLLPFIGWVALPILVLFSGLGASVLSLFSRQTPPALPVPVTEHSQSDSPVLGV